jgi:hypothetical protein
VSASDRSGNKSNASSVEVTVPACSNGSNEASVGDYSGQLEILIDDGPRGGHTQYFLNTGNGRLSIRFADKPPRSVFSGDHVHVRGTPGGEELIVASGDDVQILALDSSTTTSTSTTFSTFPMPKYTFGAQKTLVMLVNFQDNAIQPWTTDEIRTMVFGTVSNYLLENSYRQTWLTGDVAGWYTIGLNNTTCDNRDIATYSNAAAAAAGVNLSAYTRWVYVFPPTIACQWTGLATVGDNPSKAWINGKIEAGVFTHEIGHNLGLYHAHTLLPDGSTLEYGDSLDVMGSSKSAHYGAFQKERLGWLGYGNSPPILTVEAAGTYVIDAYESVGTRAKVLKVPKGVDPATGFKSYYYLESRQAIGFDGFLATVPSWQMNGANILSGLVTHTAAEHPDSSFLLDMTPETSESVLSDPALVAGKTYTDNTARLSITPLWVNATEAAVKVTFDCEHQSPTVTMSPSSSSGTLTIVYTIAVTNKDMTNCTASTFNLQPSVPTGWSAALSVSTLTLAPGASASASFTVSYPATATAGSYTVGVTAANFAYPVQASATYPVMLGSSSLSTTVITDKTTYVAGDNVMSINTTMLGTQPLAGASVTFTITKPNGVTTTQTSTTDANGKAGYKWRLNRQKDPSGSYQVRTVATSQGKSVSATTSFTVR